MERVPYSRRNGFIAVAGIALSAGLYAFLFGRAGDSSLQGPFFTLVWIVASIALLGLLALSLDILRSGASSTSQWLGMFARFIILGIWLVMHMIFLRASEADAVLQTVLTDLDLGLLVALCMLVVTAQFVLPVEGTADRMASIRRLLGHALGERGPVMYIREGEAIEAHGESQRVGPGVFLVDQASAVVFRTDTAFTRAAGPGVIFTAPGERLAEALDLRRQERRILNEPPAAEAEIPEDQQPSRSHAITRDGIPVSAEIVVEFMLDPGHEAEPREGRNPEKPPFEFHRPSVEKAVYGHVYSEFEDVPWTELPLRMVLDLWREEVKRWSLNDLLEHDGHHVSLEQIKTSMLSKLLPSEQPEDDAGENSTTRESSIIQSRGIRILDVHIRNLRVPPEIQAERQLQWRERWAGAVQDELADASNHVESYRQQGNQEANRLLLDNLLHSLDELLSAGERPARRETLNVIIADAIRMLNHEDQSPEASVTASQLQNIIDSLSQMDSNCREPER
jgi:regulator of protease activity HflC (stomatin/prohibitin superfamily)